MKITIEFDTDNAAFEYVQMATATGIREERRLPTSWVPPAGTVEDHGT